MKKLLIISLTTVVFFSSCHKENNNANNKLTIAITKEKSSKYLQNYKNWLLQYYPDIKCVDVYSLNVNSALKLANTCDGILFTGGRDIFPGRYGKIADTARCGKFDLHRDTLEYALIKQAIKNNKPIFGICRGLQIINVVLGGTLIIDIPTDYGTTVIHRQSDWQHCFHEVYVRKNSLLYKISNVDSGYVTSNHHQGIENVGSNLLVVARSADSLPEAITWADSLGKGFLMAVQWHPERMDRYEPLSKSIACRFIKASIKYKTLHDRN